MPLIVVTYLHNRPNGRPSHHAGMCTKEPELGGVCVLGRRALTQVCVRAGKELLEFVESGGLSFTQR